MQPLPLREQGDTCCRRCSRIPAPPELPGAPGRPRPMSARSPAQRGAGNGKAPSPRAWDGGRRPLRPRGASAAGRGRGGGVPMAALPPPRRRPLRLPGRPSSPLLTPHRQRRACGSGAAPLRARRCAPPAPRREPTTLRQARRAGWDARMPGPRGQGGPHPS